MKPAAIKLPGTHRVRKRLANGRTAIYWYASRGGPPLLKFEGESMGAALRAEAAGKVELAALYAEAMKPQARNPATVADLITKYKVAPDGFERLAESTKKHWNRSLDVIAAELGDLPVKALKARGAQREVIDWRNCRKATPRQADYHLTVLKRLLSWALKNGLTDANPAAGIEGIYRANRADKVVEPEELQSILAEVTERAALAIRLAATTAIRRDDLVNLRWEHVKGNHLSFTTGKSRHQRRVTVPLYGDAKSVIDELQAERARAIAAGKVPSAFVLTTEAGKKWKPDSLTQAFWRAATKLQIDRHFHDLRGTAITNFALAGFKDEQIADVVGWEPTRVRNIRKHYVDPAIISRGMIADLEKANGNG